LINKKTNSIDYSIVDIFSIFNIDNKGKKKEETTIIDKATTRIKMKNSFSPNNFYPLFRFSLSKSKK